MMHLQGIIFLVATVSLGLVNSCSLYKIQQCATAFMNEVGTEPLSEAEITRVCKTVYPTFQSCIAPHTSGCSAQERAIFEGINNMYDYVCNEGKADAVAYNPCLKHTALQADIKDCETAMNSKISSDPNASQDTKCGYMDEFLDCTYKATKAECGAEAAEFQDKCVRLTLGPLWETTECGCSAITAMMWLVGGALLLQWLIR